MAALEETKLYTFKMNDGTEPWKISERFLDEAEVAGEQVPFVMLAPYDWGLASVVTGKNRKDNPLLSGSDGMKELMELRNDAISRILFPPDPAAELLGRPPAPRGRRRPWQESLVEPSGVAEVEVTIPEDAPMMASERRTLQFMWPSSPRSTPCVQLEAAQLEFVVHFLRAFSAAPPKPRKRRASTPGADSSDSQSTPAL